jgi:RHS repeat-associated protein
VVYYLNDHLGTAQLLVDAAGIVIWQGDAQPFGQVTEVINQIDHRFRFPGQMVDPENGFYYNWNRFYDPETGRYLSADPIGLDGGMNLYLYAEANPINFTDPMGLSAAECMRPGGRCEPLGPPVNIISPIGIGIGIAIGEYLFGDTTEPYINEDGTVKDKETNCDDSGKWKCEGYGQYDQVGTPKHVRRGSQWHVAYGSTEALAYDAWIKKAQSAAPPGFTARHIRPRCTKVK